jgi:cellulose synthase/poly-beta-1,6-N-acetylglucosamine synthase-like glycosyltransferase
VGPSRRSRPRGAGQRTPLTRIDLDQALERIDVDAAKRLAAPAARAYRAVVLGSEGGRALVAFALPEQRAISAVKALTGLEVDAVLADAGAIERAQERIYGISGRARTARRTSRYSSSWTAEERRRCEELAARTGLPFFSLEPMSGEENLLEDPVDRDAARLLGAEVCRSLGVLPLEAHGGSITVATPDPYDHFAARVVRAMTGRRVRWVIAPASELERATLRTFGRDPGAPLEGIGELRGDQDEPESTVIPEAAPAPAVAEEPEEEAAGPQRIGEILISRGLVKEDEIRRALEIQRRTGDRLGQILMHISGVPEEPLAGAIADQSHVTAVDLDSFEPEPEALALVPEHIYRQHRIVPLAVADGALAVAMMDPRDGDAIAALREHVDMPLRITVASPSAIDRLLQRVYRREYSDTAVHDLMQRAPGESAFYVFSRGQRITMLALLLVFGIALVLFPIPTLVAVNVISIVIYVSFGLYRFYLVYRSEHDYDVTAEDAAEIDERTLPPYTVLVPLYNEATVIPHLVAALERLDYPPTKLDVKLLLEEEDTDSLDVLDDLDLPPHIRPVIVPHSHPKTKPKACNYGLLHARGDLVVIYDAEDEPEPDQLKKVIASFRRAEERVVCVQCKLNYYNQNQNLLTRWFTTEYSMWFDLFMPGLDATDAPIPLGGTSNHFLKEKLIELGGWDPFNVTEDADLGIRLHRHGYKTAIIDSTTFEEANSDLRNWIRQRSRWVKGYMQTWLVQMRNPVELLRALGLRRFLAFQLVVGGTFMTFLLNPFYWGLTTLWALSEAGVINQIFPGVVYYAGGFALFVGNFLFAYLTAAGAAHRGYDTLVKYALLAPLYWALMSIGAWKGLIQLFRKPFYWEKTHHGLHLRPAVEQEPDVEPATLERV